MFGMCFVKNIMRFFLLVSTISFSMPIAEAKNLLKEAKEKFDKAHYKEAIDKLSKLDIIHDFDSYSDIKQAYEILIVSYFQVGQKEKSKEIIRDFLMVDKDFTLPHFSTPPDVLKLLEEERLLLQEKSKNLAQSKTVIKINIPEKIEKTSFAPKDKNKFLISVMPFGINHYFFDDKIKTITYATLQASTLLANIASFWIKQNYLNSYNGLSIKSGDLVKSFKVTQNIQFISLTGFILAYGVSVVDALVSN